MIKDTGLVAEKTVFITCVVTIDYNLIEIYLFLLIMRRFFSLEKTVIRVN